MSTRAHIGFYSKHVNDGDAGAVPDVLVYAHSDGYPEYDHGRAASVARHVAAFVKARGFHEADYMSAQVLAGMIMESRRARRRWAQKWVDSARKDLAKLRRKWNRIHGKEKGAETWAEAHLYDEAEAERINARAEQLYQKIRLAKRMGWTREAKQAQAEYDAATIRWKIKWERERIEEYGPKAKAPVDVISDDSDVLSYGIDGDKQRHCDCEYYYAVMPGKIRVYAIGTKNGRDHAYLLTSEAEAKRLYEGKLPKRWTTAVHGAKEEAEREKVEAMSDKQRDAYYDRCYKRDRAAMQRRDAQLRAKLEPKRVAETSGAGAQRFAILTGVAAQTQAIG